MVILIHNIQSNYKPREGEETMKALTFQGAKDVKVVDAQIPDITQDVRAKIGWQDYRKC